jgi:hypothetical protein
MSNFRSLQMQFLDDLLWMGGGYVLNFSDRTFAEFFREELNIDIDDPKWSVQGGSKGKRMRYFLQTAPRETVAKTLVALWEHRAAAMERNGTEETIRDVHGKKGRNHGCHRWHGYEGKKVRGGPQGLLENSAVPQFNIRGICVIRG